MPKGVPAAHPAPPGTAIVEQESINYASPLEAAPAKHRTAHHREIGGLAANADWGRGLVETSAEARKGRRCPIDRAGLSSGVKFRRVSDAQQ
jgi:hypothetical protein